MADPRLHLTPAQALARAEQIVEKDNLAVADARHSFAEEQTVAAEAPALVDNHALRSAFAAETSFGWIWCMMST